MGNLNQAWANIQARQEQEGIAYGDIDPTKMPGWPDAGSRNSSEGRKFKTQVDWLNQDSIESLKQASGGFTMNQRRQDPVRLSMPRAPLPIPMTQRGRCGKLTDSQQYPHLNQT